MKKSGSFVRSGNVSFFLTEKEEDKKITEKKTVEENKTKKTIKQIGKHYPSKPWWTV